MLTLVLPILIAGCGTMAAKKEPLAQGTPVKLVLLRPLQAGEAKEGSTVPLMVSEDVKNAEGKVLLAKGTLASAEVKWSRSEGTLSGLMNQPARLTIQLKETKAADGSTVRLTANKEAEEENVYAFTRDNTGKVDFGEQIEELVKSEASQRLLNEINTALQGGNTPDLNSEDSKKVLQEISSKLSLQQTASILSQGKSDELSKTLEAVNRGQSLAALASGGSLTSVMAVVELANVALEVGSRVSRMLKGRTIRAYAGTEVPAYVEAAVEVVPKEPEQ